MRIGKTKTSFNVVATKHKRSRVSYAGAESARKLGQQRHTKQLLAYLNPPASLTSSGASRRTSTLCAATSRCSNPAAPTAPSPAATCRQAANATAGPTGAPEAACFASQSDSCPPAQSSSTNAGTDPPPLSLPPYCSQRMKRTRLGWRGRTARTAAWQRRGLALRK